MKREGHFLMEPNCFLFMITIIFLKCNFTITNKPFLRLTQNTHDLSSFFLCIYTLYIYLNSLNGQHGFIPLLFKWTAWIYPFTLLELSVSLLMCSVILCEYIVTKNKKYMRKSSKQIKKLKTLQTGG